MSEWQWLSLSDCQWVTDSEWQCELNLHLQSPEQVEPQHSSLPSLKFSCSIFYVNLFRYMSSYHEKQDAERKTEKWDRKSLGEKETFLPQQLLSCSLWIKLIDIRLFGIYIVITNINKIIGLATKWEHNFSKTWIVALPYDNSLLMITFSRLFPFLWTLQRQQEPI